MLRAAADGGGQERCCAEGLAAGLGSALLQVREKHPLEMCQWLGGLKENQN